MREIEIEREREREREGVTGEKEKKLQTQKNSWNFILSCFNPVTIKKGEIIPKTKKFGCVG